MPQEEHTHLAVTCLGENIFVSVGDFNTLLNLEDAHWICEQLTNCLEGTDYEI